MRLGRPQGRERLRHGSRRLAIALVIGWLAVMAAGGWALVTAQANSRRSVAARVQSRAEYTASFISIYSQDMLTRERAAAQSWLTNPHVDRATLDRVSSALGLSDAALGPATGGAGSSMFLTQLDRVPAIVFAVEFRTPSGSRVFSGAYGIAGTVLPTVLDHTFSMPGWRAFLIDPAGGRLSGGPGGGEGKELHFSAKVAGTGWRMTVSAPENELYGFFEGSGRWVAWLALAALTGAGLAVILLLVRLQRSRAQLTGLNRELGRLAAVDPLTDLRNRRAIEQQLSDSLSAARRHDLPLSLLIIDIDHFKAFNDQLGHQQGDAVLAHAARVLDRALRAEDAIGRWGGEEFLVVLPGTDEQGALHVTERLRVALAADQPESARAHQLPVTITIGLAEWGEESIGELISRADSALYLGKDAGRDTVHVSRVRPAVA
jgi:diguanylate cyclase (GGDEF)-like protein